MVYYFLNDLFCVSFASVAFMRVSVTLFVPSLGCIPTGRTVALLRDLGRFLILPAGHPFYGACASVATLLLSYVPV